MRLSPLDPELVQMWSGLGMAKLMAGENEAALDALRRSVHGDPNWAVTLRGLIFAFVRLGRTEDARETARRLLEADPGYRIGARPLTVPKGVFRDEFLAAMRLAGLPN